MSVIKTVILNPYKIDKICRICLEEKANLISLFTSVQFEEESIIPTSIPDIIVQLTSEIIHSENGFPDQICMKCTDLIKSAYLFKLKFEKSSRILKSYFEKKCKRITYTESDSNEDNTSSCETHLLHKEADAFEKEQTEKFELTTNTEYQSEDSLECNNAVEYEEAVTNSRCSIEFLQLSPCPICTMELPAVELRQHVHSHKALKGYLTIPKVNKNAKFYASGKNVVSLFTKKEILHKCPFCNQCYPVPQFRVHVENHRSDEFKCDKCNKAFRKLNNLNTHRAKHLKEYLYKCDECRKGFVIKRNYDCHMLTHTNNEQNRIVHTEDTSSNREIVDTKVPSKTSDKVFQNSSGSYNQIKSRRKRKKREKTLCSVCGTYVTYLQKHMLMHTGEKPHPCNQCNKRFACKTQLGRHLMVHSGQKPFVCTICAKAFNKLYNVQVHERIHKGENRYICTVCNKGFAVKAYLKLHMNKHKNIN